MINKETNALYPMEKVCIQSKLWAFNHGIAFSRERGLSRENAAKDGERPRKSEKAAKDSARRPRESEKPHRIGI